MNTPLTDRPYWAALAHVDHLGGIRVLALLEAFGSARAVWEASRGALLSVSGIGEGLADQILAVRRTIDPARTWDGLQAAGIHCITIQDDAYPALLREIHAPPAALFVQGRLPSGPAVAIVGTRKATSVGRALAEDLGRELAANGVVVVSGLALGIDGAAHRGALDVAGPTVAVLGCGLDICYPPDHARLQGAIACTGAVVSEYPLGTPPRPFRFPARNRIIAGLVLGVVVVEAQLKSGALITAQMALESGREVFAVPGSPRHAASAGPNRLLRDGACLVETASDIMKELNLPRENQGPPLPPLTPVETPVFHALGPAGTGVDEVVERTGMAPGQVVGVLAGLEVRGLVRRLPGPVFAPRIITEGSAWQSA